ncbi:MAG: toprim domain-containing protein [Planktotalea arctica]
MTDENTNGVRPDDRGARAEAIRQALSDRAEDLFRLAWGEPTKANGRHWRARETSARSMVVQGPKRGQWFDHTAGTGGDLLDLVAIELCGLNSARDDFPRVLQEAAKFCGITDNENIDLSALMVRKAEREAKSALEAASKAQSDAQLIKALQARALPLSGSPAASYLASRGIDVMPEGWSYLPPIHGLGVLSPHRPALVAWAVDAAGQVTGGQRVLILNDGSKAPEDPRKPAFGTIGGSPARIPARVEGGPLCIAEGPETAAAIAQATGFEVWAVFGASGFATAPPPLDRQVIFCPDQDATDSPAAKAFDAARDAHAQRGVDVWVARAPEPEGSKRDLADTLRDSGPEVVERALAQAVKFRHREEVEAPAGNPQRQITALPPVMDADRARTRLQAEVAEGLRRDGVTLIEATLGLGKTSATIKALPALFDEADSKGINGAVVMAFPMHRLGQQVVADIEATVKGRSVVQLYGVEAKDPNKPDETVCKQLDAYRERTALHLDTNELCGFCPFADDCLHQKSIGAVADIYVVSHERLKAAGTPLRSDQTLLATVVDESPLNALMSANRRPVPLAALLAAPTRMTRKSKELTKLEQEADLRAFREKLQNTIEAHGLGYLRLTDLRGWTSEDALAAHKLEWGRKIEDEEHPEIAHNKTLTAAAGVFGEIQRSIDEGIAENARLQIRHGENGLECVLSGLRPISESYRTAPVLMLDATANVEVAALLAGEALAHHVEIRAKENITIEQDPNLSGAKSFFFAKGQPTGNVANAAYFAKAKAMEGRTAVIGNKDTIAAMDLPSEILTGHFNALRGMNEMQDAEQAIIIGRTLPPTEAIARMVGAIWGTPCTGDLDHKGTTWRPVEDEQGMRLEQTKAATHSDERGEMILRLIRDAEVTQAIGRLRAVNRTNAPVRCTVISDAVLDYPVRLVDLRRTLQAHGTLGPMMDRGAVFLSPSQASKAYPDLYASKQAAAKVLDRLTDWATFSIRGLYGKGCPVVELQTPRARNTTQAIIAPWVEDAATEVKRHLPQTEVVTPTAEIMSLPAAPVSIPAPDVVPADVVNLQDSRSWKRHRAKLNNMGHVALAAHKRVRAAGLPIGGRLSQVALALHETQDKDDVARKLNLTAKQVHDVMIGLYVMGLIDADGALDGPLKRRKLVWAVGPDSPITDDYAAQRRALVRMIG